jgi:hypothetical protein
VLVLLDVAGTLGLLEAELAQASDSTHRWGAGRSNFDQVENGFFGPPQRFVDRDDADLLAVLVG